MSLKRRSFLFLALVLGLVAGSLAVIALRPTVLGLDLRGGSQAILQGRPTATAQVTPDAIQRSIDVIRNRVDKFGVSEPEIQKVGPDQISVSLPGVTDPNVLGELIKPAQLVFYEYEPNVVPPAGQAAPGVSNQNPSSDLYALIKLAQTSLPKQPLQPDAAPSVYLFRKGPAHTLVAGPQVSVAALRQSLRQATDPALKRAAARFAANPKAFDLETVPKGFLIFPEDRDGAPSGTYSLLYDNPGLTGKDIASARQQFGQGDQPIVTMQFRGPGKEKFHQLTRDLVQKGRLAGGNPYRFAVVLDGHIITNPQVDYHDPDLADGIPGDNGAEIRGGFTEKSAKDLANQLNSGAIPIKLDTISLQKVGATLGKESLHEGLIAGAIGLGIVMLFLIAYYRLLGVVAALALVVYGAFFYAVAKLVPITLTLPGIAGLILTIGVAADANVVIFERVREEARAGRNPRAALLGGYKKGISAIIDANVVTLVTAGILFLFATAGPKGFAFTLLIGVVLSLFTAVLATQAAFGLLADTKLFRNERLMGLNMREIRWKFDFVGKWRLWLAISFIPLAAGAILIGTRGLELGLDFTSGTRLTESFQGKVQPNEGQIRATLKDLGYGDAKVQAFTRTVGGQTGRQGFEIQTKTLQPGQISKIEQTLTNRFGPRDESEINSVGPVLGRQIVRNAIYAVVISFLAIIVYLSFRFEYKLALSALLSVIHDVWLALSIYSLTGREVTSATVAALLTILGYSLYDVVIVFDRIRENVPLMRNKTYREIVNTSVHETLTRSIITSVLTLLPVAVLFLFGGPTLKDFAFALLIGILSGGLSSIAISAPIAALWKEREPESKRREARIRKRAVRVNRADADVVDLDALARAEAALEGQLAGGHAAPAGLIEDRDGDVPEPEPPAAATRAEPEAPEPAPVPEGDGGEPRREAPPPERVRRHRQVQRRRRR